MSIDLKHTALIGLSAGAVQAGLTFVWPGLTKGFNVFDGKLLGIPLLPTGRYAMPALAAGVGFASGMLGDVAHHYILPHLSADSRLSNLESLIFLPAAGAFLTNFAYNKANPRASEDFGSESLFALGAASVVGGLWLHDMFLAPWFGDKVGY